MEKKECCQHEENMRYLESGKDDLTIMVCQVCACRHFELTVDPLKLGMRGAAL